jgi:hypothetical protein
MGRSKAVFAITEDHVQLEAERIVGRRLTRDEMYFATKGIEAGLSFDVDTVYATAIEEAVEQASSGSK